MLTVVELLEGVRFGDEVGIQDDRSWDSSGTLPAAVTCLSEEVGAQGSYSSKSGRNVENVWKCSKILKQCILWLHSGTLMVENNWKAAQLVHSFPAFQRPHNPRHDCVLHIKLNKKAQQENHTESYQVESEHFWNPHS